MKVRYCLTLAALTVSVLSFSPVRVLAQNPAPPAPPAATPEQIKKDPQSAFEPKNEPGEGQKLMEKMAGEWDVQKSIFPPGKPPRVTKGSCHQTMMNEGRFLKSEFTFTEADGAKTVGLGVLGFDAASGLFSSTWCDSRSTRFSLRQSEEKFNGEEVVLYAKTLGGAGADARKSRTIARLEDGGKRLVHRQYIPGADGKEFVIMELLMTRREK